MVKNNLKKNVGVSKDQLSSSSFLSNYIFLMNLSNSGNFGFDRERGTEETLSLPIHMLQLKILAKLQSPFSVGDLPFNVPYSPKNVTSGAR